MEGNNRMEGFSHLSFPCTASLENCIQGFPVPRSRRYLGVWIVDRRNHQGRKMHNANSSHTKNPYNMCLYVYACQEQFAWKAQNTQVEQNVSQCCGQMSSFNITKENRQKNWEWTGYTYGGIDATNRCPSNIGFKPKGDETMACSNSFKVWKKKRMFVETFHIAHNHHVENTYIILKVKITQANHSCQFYCGGCFALFYWNWMFQYFGCFSVMQRCSML